jgi:SAM-dependent methyltransferase
VNIITDDIAKYGPPWWDRQYGARIRMPGRDARLRYRTAATIIGSDSVLDVGCGPGWFVEYISRPRGYIGIDWSAEAIATANRLYGPGSLRFSQRERPKFRTQRLVDCQTRRAWAVAFQVFEHDPEPERFVAAMSALATVGIIVSLPDGDFGRQIIEADSIQMRQIHGDAFRYHFATYDREDIAEMFPSAEFVDIDDRHLMFVLRR